MTFRLGLRFNQHEVSLVKTNGNQREQLGVAYPDDADKRAKIMTHWGQNTQSPRRPELNSITQPLPKRAQAILSYKIPSQQRAIVNGEQKPLVQSRRDTASGVKNRMHINTHTAIHVESSGHSPTQQHTPVTPPTRAKK